MGKTMDEKLDDLALAVKEGFDEVTERLKGHDARFVGIEKRLDGLGKTVANLPDKAFLTDKLADIEGPMVSRTRKQEERFKMLVEYLHAGKVLTKDQLSRLAQFEIFPHFPAA